MGSKPWIELDFSSPGNGAKSLKRKSKHFPNGTNLINFDIINFKPKSVDDLFINKTKLREIENAIKNPNSKFILLTGPSGCGKSITIDLLAQKLNFRVDYYSNDNKFDLKFDRYGSKIVQNDQLEDFLDFLVESSRNFDISSKNTSKLIVVDEYPQNLMKDLCKFYQKLTYLKNRTQKFKIVFICNTEDNYSTTEKNGRENLNFRKIFADSILEDFSFQKIKMNPFTNRSVAAFLKNILTKAKIDPSRFSELIDLISQKSNGDMRSAILALDMSLHSQDFDLQNLLACSSSNSKDQNPGLFSCLGKILYSKRIENPEIEASSSMFEQILPKMAIEIEEIFEYCGLSPEFFLSYLHTNFLSLLESSNDDRSLISRICDDFSFCDLFTSNVNLPYDAKDKILPYVSTICGRSLAFYMYFLLYDDKTTNSRNFKFLQMTKPTSSSSCSNFGANMNLNIFATELAPFMCKLGNVEEQVLRLGSFNLKFRNDEKAFIVPKPKYAEQIRLKNLNDSVVNDNFECDIDEFDD